MRKRSISIMETKEERILDAVITYLESKTAQELADEIGDGKVHKLSELLDKIEGRDE